MSRGLGAVVLVVVAASAWWWWSSRDGDAIEVDMASVAGVESLKAFVTASGEIVATKYPDLGSSVMGRLVSLNVREGDEVRAGQVLARIDPIQAESVEASASAAALGPTNGKDLDKTLFKIGSLE